MTSIPARLPGRAWLAGGGLLALAFCPERAVAGAFELSPKVGQTTTYDDNVGLQSRDKVSTLVSRTGIDLDADMGTAATNLKLSIGAALLRYFSESSLNTDDETIAFNLTHSGRRYRAGLEGSFVRDTAISDPLDLDVGRGGLANARRYTYALAPSFAYQLDRTQSFELSGAYTHRDFDGDGENELGGNTTPYSQYRSRLSWFERLDPRLRTGIGVNAIHVDTSRQETNLVSAVGIVEWQASPRLALNGNVGPGIARTETTLPTGLGGSAEDSDDRLGYYFQAGIDWLPTPRTTTRLSISRSVQPYGTGQRVVTRNGINLSGEHKLSRRLSFNVNAAYLLDQPLGDHRGDGVDDGDSEALFVSPGLRWALTKDVDLSLAYRLRYKSFERSDSDATSHAVVFRVGLALPSSRSNW